MQPYTIRRSANLLIRAVKNKSTLIHLIISVTDEWLQLFESRQQFQPTGSAQELGAVSTQKTFPQSLLSII